MHRPSPCARLSADPSRGAEGWDADLEARIDFHWSRFLGVPASALRSPGVVVTPHAQLSGYRGVWFFVRGDSAVVSAPPEWVARLRRVCGSTVATELISHVSAAPALREAAAGMIGPSFQGWLSRDRFRPVASDRVHRVSESKLAIISALRSACTPAEWEHGGIDVGAGEIWASFEGPNAVALGQLRPHLDGAVDPCVITHPDHRGQGHALRVVGAMAEDALSADRLVLYQTLLSNVPAVSIALRLGFEQYATLLAVRLAPE
jgi:GNAT superfamily N-acetyltransferase